MCPRLFFNELLPWIRLSACSFQKMFCNVFFSIINENSQEFLNLFRRYELLKISKSASAV